MSDTLTVHTMPIALIPYFVCKCEEPEWIERSEERCVMQCKCGGMSTDRIEMILERK